MKWIVALLIGGGLALLAITSRTKKRNDESEHLDKGTKAVQRILGSSMLDHEGLAKIKSAIPSYAALQDSIPKLVETVVDRGNIYLQSYQLSHKRAGQKPSQHKPTEAKLKENL